MAGHAIVLAGAPEADQLRWDDIDLLTGFGMPVKRFLDDRPAAPALQTQKSSPTQAAAKWRAVPMSNPEHDAAVLEPKNVPQTQFLSFEQRGDGTESQERIRFLEHSLARLNELDSSQIAAPEETTAFATTYSFATATTGTSFGTIPASFSFSATSPAKPGPATGPFHLKADITDLKRIPPADHINRIHPQTITVSILAAIISISPSRTVRLRKRAGEMDVIELLLGDETRAGFSISFWLAPVESQQAKQPADDLRRQLQALRAGDVLLLQNVALSAFRGCVYGQSLSRRFARNSTGVVVLTDGTGLPLAVGGKFERVRQWGDEFVETSRRMVEKDAGGLVREELPPDTQSGEEGE